MKKLILLAIAFIAFQTSFAQKFSKGDTFVEGTVKFVSSDAEKTFDFNPSVGHFLTDKVAVGIDVDTQSTKNAAGVKTSDSFGLGAFARCYFLEVNKLHVYSQLRLSTNDDKATDDKATDVKDTTLDLGLPTLVSKASIHYHLQ